ncbi:beta-galactosidase-1-like protein 2 [Sycon ciliatum]|uniref:beta-galactosidase-1-like protein 2 n=1 Tax=Sycon ciliatum TaxID=27933 RepID=UPI0031F5FF98
MVNTNPAYPKREKWTSERFSAAMANLALQRFLPPEIRVSPRHVKICAALILVLFVLPMVYVVLRPGRRSSYGIQGWEGAGDVGAALSIYNPPCLVAKGTHFALHNKSMLILSGAIHYFRVPSAYWEDRMRKLQSMGLNTVETYVPWNLHEPRPGQFDFSGMLDLRRYIHIAKTLGLNVILRPGPYICSEWDFGGLPAWLMRDNHMKVRTLYPPFVAAVERYFNKLIPLVADLQCHRGGPIIAVQIENEYGSFAADANYMRYLEKAMTSRGIKEMLFTSDNMWGTGLKSHLLPDILQTANFQKEWKENIDLLKVIQPNRPLMAMELWSGWFDHWHEESHHTTKPEELADTVENMIKNNMSINFYMFHGGTNFGFMNGANDGGKHDEDYMADVTSYDYDAPLSEWGATTRKFDLVRDVIKRLVPGAEFPALPDPLPVKSYGQVEMHLCLPLLEALSYLPKPTESKTLRPMEMLNVNEKSGQAYGYVLYRTMMSGETRKLRLSDVHDWAAIIVPGEETLYMERFKGATYDLKPSKKHKRHLNLLVENMGRVNYGEAPLTSRKGILGNVWADGNVVSGWTTYSIEFKPDFLSSISSGGQWERSPPPVRSGPTLYKSSLRIDGEPADTFIDLKGWSKGAVFINGINLGRYWHVGPQKRLYVPAPFLRKGINTVIIFEVQQAPTDFMVTFSDQPDLG